MKEINLLERQLVQNEFSLEQSDMKIAQQIHALLLREQEDISMENEELLTSLTEKLIYDEKRRKKILKQIISLQKKKKS